MDPLFIEQPKFEKVARRLLSQDATKWTKEILDEFFTEYPFFMSQNVELQFKKRNDEKGYAVGTITIGELTIPIIVNEFNLAPFDVVYKDGKTLPLTEATLGSLSANDGAFKRVMPVDSSSEEVDMLFQKPLVDLQPNAGFGKKASVIDRISDTITTDHKKSLLEKLSSKEIQVGFERNGTIDVLKKIADVNPKPRSYFKESLSKVLPRDIHYLEKVSRFKYRFIEGNSDVYDPIITELEPEQAQAYEDFKASGEEVEKKANFRSIKGAIYDTDYGEDKLIIMNVDGVRKHSYLKKEASTKEKCQHIFGGEMPKIGDYGVWTDGNKASKPFEVVGMIKSAQHYEINAFDGTGNKDYVPLRSVDEITPHEDRNNTYYVPAKYRFVKVGDFTEIEPGGNEKDKTANYFTRDDVDLYKLQGPTFEKYAEFGEDISTMTQSEAIWAALQCNANDSDIKKIADAPQNVRIPFESNLKAPQHIDKVASYLGKEYEKYSTTIKALASDLVKEASTLTDPESVDAILALNMITKENILEFVSQLPLYEQVLSGLAKLLLTVRLGLSSIPEYAVQQSMKELSKVVEILRGISKLEKVKT